jgi:hypothetical protein
MIGNFGSSRKRLRDQSRTLPIESITAIALYPSSFASKNPIPRVEWFLDQGRLHRSNELREGHPGQLQNFVLILVLA